MKGLKLSLFKKIYIVYTIVLIALSVAAIMYVKGLLHEYEAMRPEQHVEDVITELAQEATSEAFFTKYGLPEVAVEKFEEQIDVKKEYLALLTSKDVSYSLVNEKSEEDVLYYTIENEGNTLAEVKLKAVGPAVTKLAVLSFREWQVEEIKPILEKQDYTVLLPLDFTIRANGIEMTAEDGTTDGKSITYTVAGAYLRPTFEIKSQDGKNVTYTIDKNTVHAEFYDFALALPSTLTVQVNGAPFTGEAQENGRVNYSIRTLENPEIIISDLYGNTYNYDGKNEIPLTYMTVLADSRYSVKVDEKDVAEGAISVTTNKEYDALKDYVANLPQVNTYHIAVLKIEAELVVMDENGNAVNFEAGKEVYDFTEMQGLLVEVPAEVVAEVDILKVAQDWSLFMSNDKKFAEIQQYLIKESYQYNVALQYATGVDITFMASHILANPAFTENTVTNFKWISDNCFSVDVHFVKHMLLRSGTLKADDTTNDTFYFVKWDDTDDGVDNPTWKIASMREIINNEN